jgi:hypothetical protein
VSSQLDVALPEAAVEVDRPWITLVWNDPINLMSYVTYVFMEYFTYDRAKAEFGEWLDDYLAKALDDPGAAESAASPAPRVASASKAGSTSRRRCGPRRRPRCRHAVSP